MPNFYSCTTGDIHYAFLGVGMILSEAKLLIWIQAPSPWYCYELL